jgi:hypothetical protein
VRLESRAFRARARAGSLRPIFPRKRELTSTCAMRALIANGPAMYREVISIALRELRPGVEVFTARPEDLEMEFLRLLPQLVVCSRLTKRVERAAPVWIELYPDGSSHAIVGRSDGARTSLPSIDFDTILSILDGA